MIFYKKKTQKLQNGTANQLPSQAMYPDNVVPPNQQGAVYSYPSQATFPDNVIPPNQQGARYTPAPPGGPDKHTQVSYWSPAKKAEMMGPILAAEKEGRTLTTEEADWLRAYKRVEFERSPEYFKTINSPSNGIERTGVLGIEDPGAARRAAEDSPVAVTPEDAALIEEIAQDTSKAGAGVAPTTKAVPATAEEVLKAYEDGRDKATSPESIKALQSQLGVEADGILGKETEKAYRAKRRELYLGTEAGKSEDEKIKKVQRRLGVKADGIWGKNTQTAWQKLQDTKAMQRRLGVKDDGIVGDKTKAKLEEQNKTVSEISSSGTPGVQVPIRRAAVVKPASRKEARQSRRATRKKYRQDRRVAREEKKKTLQEQQFSRGGIFCNTIER